ncbi:unnamed protein product [Pylaiella littoralis]
MPASVCAPLSCGGCLILCDRLRFDRIVDLVLRIFDTHLRRPVVTGKVDISPKQDGLLRNMRNVQALGMVVTAVSTRSRAYCTTTPFTKTGFTTWRVGFAIP